MPLFDSSQFQYEEPGGVPGGDYEELCHRLQPRGAGGDWRGGGEAGGQHLSHTLSGPGGNMREVRIFLGDRNILNGLEILGLRSGSSLSSRT